MVGGINNTSIKYSFYNVKKIFHLDLISKGTALKIQVPNIIPPCRDGIST